MEAVQLLPSVKSPGSGGRFGIELTLGTPFVVLALTTAWSARSSPGTTFLTLTSHASYPPAFLTSSLRASSFAPPLLTLHSPCPLPSLPAILLRRSLVALSILPIFSWSFLRTVPALGTTLPVKAGTFERWARMRSDLSGLLNEAPFLRRPDAGTSDVAACRRLLRTDASPEVSTAKSSSDVEGIVEGGPVIFLVLRDALPMVPAVLGVVLGGRESGIRE
jgi:hypothetical protein